MADQAMGEALRSLKPTCRLISVAALQAAVEKYDRAGHSGI